MLRPDEHECGADELDGDVAQVQRRVHDRTQRPPLLADLLHPVQEFGAFELLDARQRGQEGDEPGLEGHPCPFPQPVRHGRADGVGEVTHGHDDPDGHAPADGAGGLADRHRVDDHLDGVDGEELTDLVRDGAGHGAEGAGPVGPPTGAGQEGQAAEAPDLRRSCRGHGVTSSTNRDACMANIAA